jgi:DNA primase
MSAVEEIKARIDIVDLVSESGVKLRKSGRSYTGFCPFHHNTKTPAFVVWPETGTWRCFGECNEGGDIFKYVMKKEGMDFKEALRYLADKAGVELQAYTPQQEEAHEREDFLSSLLEEAATYYHSLLKQSKEGASALAYLREKRGLTDSTIEAFMLGYAPRGWETTLQHFLKRGYKKEDLLEAGLVSERESGGMYDRFRHRLMIPIRDERGRMAGFGARALEDGDMPKYLNSPQTALFDKGRLLYGLDRARKAIRAADRAVIVEGYLDVIAPHQAGFENVVSPMGTALTEAQLRLLKRYSRRIVLALDPDAAGQKAVLRGLEAARQSLDRETDMVFDARGFLHHEARLRADLRVVNLPDGLDPDEIVLRNPQEWESLIESAKPIVIHVMDTLAAGRDLDDPKVKSEIAEKVLPLIADVANPVERDSYRQMLARMLKVDERALSGTKASPARPKRRRKTLPPEPAEEAESPPAAEESSYSDIKVERYFLQLLLSRPDLLPRLDRALRESHLPPLDFEDFRYTGHQEMLRFLRESLLQDEMEPAAYVLMHVPEALEDFSEEDAALPNARVLEEALRRLIDLRRKRLNENLVQLRFLQEEAQNAGDLYAASYQEAVLQHFRLLKDLDEARRRLRLRRIE